MQRTRKPILEIYALAVCFVCIALFAIFSSTAIYNGIKITNPEFTLPPYEYGPHQNNENFLEAKLMANSAERAGIYEDMTPPELTEARNRSYRAAIENERRRGQQSLLQSLIALAVLALTFALHWKLARKTRQQTS